MSSSPGPTATGLQADWQREQVRQQQHWLRTRGMFTFRGETRYDQPLPERARDLAPVLVQMAAALRASGRMVERENRYLARGDRDAVTLHVLLPVALAIGDGDEEFVYKALWFFDLYEPTINWQQAESTVLSQPPSLPGSQAMPLPTIQDENDDGSEPPMSQSLVEIAIGAIFLASVNQPGSSERENRGTAAFFTDRLRPFAEVLATSHVTVQGALLRYRAMLAGIGYTFASPTVYDVVVACDGAVWSSRDKERVIDTIRLNAAELTTLRAASGQLLLLAALDSSVRNVPDPWVTGAALVLLMTRMGFGNVAASRALVFRLMPLLTWAVTGAHDRDPTAEAFAGIDRPVEDRAKVLLAAIVDRSNALQASMAEFMTRREYRDRVQRLLVAHRPSSTFADLTMVEQFVRTAGPMAVPVPKNDPQSEEAKRQRTT